MDDCLTLDNLKCMIGGLYWIDFFSQTDFTVVGSDQHSFTVNGNMRAPFFLETVEWIRQSRNSMPKDQIENSMKRCKIHKFYWRIRRWYVLFFSRDVSWIMDYPHLLIIWILWVSKRGKLRRNEDVMPTDCDVKKNFFGWRREEISSKFISLIIRSY